VIRWKSGKVKGKEPGTKSQEPGIQDPAFAGELNVESGTNPAECNEAGKSEK